MKFSKYCASQQKVIDKKLNTVQEWNSCTNRTQQWCYLAVPALQLAVANMEIFWMPDTWPLSPGKCSAEATGSLKSSRKFSVASGKRRLHWCGRSKCWPAGVNLRDQLEQVLISTNILGVVFFSLFIFNGTTERFFWTILCKHFKVFRLLILFYWNDAFLDIQRPTKKKI